MKAGTYKLSFDTEDYWKKRGQESFYPYVEVTAMAGCRTGAQTLLAAPQFMP